MLSLLLPLFVFAGAPDADAVKTERCVGCHTDPALIRSTHASLIATHPVEQFGCVSCHGGDARASEPLSAHASSGPNELLRPPHRSAACVTCHVPGAVPGSEVASRGARLYLELGCQLCHKSANGFGYPAAFAPPLGTIGHRGSAYLRQVLRDPASLFKATVMPGFAGAFAADPGSEDALLSYLLSLRAEAQRSTRSDATLSCVACHADDRAKVGDFGRHRCQWLKDERAHLSCKGCHAKGVPPSKLECLYIAQRRRDCGVCHPGGVDGQ